MLRHRSFHTGDRVVFTVEKHGAHPGRNARDIRPELHGEGYHYQVDKFWIVRDVTGSQLVIQTRRGKLRSVDMTDPNLRLAHWWERFLHARRFPRLDGTSPVAFP
jgi:hypothetical protein